MDNVTYLTKEGLVKLEKELEHLKGVERLEVADAIGEAKEYGDLSENSEYDAAKEREALLENKIREIEEKLKNVEIITKKNIDTTKVSVGCKVKLEDVVYKDQFEYTIVGATESDPEKGLISNESPVGEAMLGKKKGDTVVVETPGGKSEFKIVKISA